MTYTTSVAECEKLGGHLVTINTPAEWAWVKQTFLSGNPDNEFRTVYLGIELPEKRWWNQEGEVKWIDGTAFDEKTLKEFWAGGHPWGHRDDKGYHFRWIMNHAGQWATVGPVDPRVNGYICEWDK